MENNNNGNYGKDRQGSQYDRENNPNQDLQNAQDHNMSSGSAYLEEEVDKASHQLDGGHDYMENNGNSSVDYNLHRSIGNDTDFDNTSHLQEMRSDNDDFNDSGFDDDNSLSAASRTYDEDTKTSREQTNAGTPNNNWDANNPMDRGIHDDEDKNV